MLQMFNDIMTTIDEYLYFEIMHYGAAKSMGEYFFSA